MFAIIPHEVAHGYVALKMGDPTAKNAGRLTLNPAKHIEPLGLLCFVLVGIGWAKPVPVNPFNYKNFRKANFWVSIAGIITNLILGFIASLVMVLLTAFAGGINNLGIFFVYEFFMLFMVINISLAIFNFFPVYPLDGYNILVSFTKPNNKFMIFMQENATVMLLVFMAVVMFTDTIGIVRDGLVALFESFWRFCLPWV